MKSRASLAQWLASSHLSGINAAYIEDVYEQFLTDPDGVPEYWCSFFSSLPKVGAQAVNDVPHSRVRHQFLQKARAKSQIRPVEDSRTSDMEADKQIRFLKLIQAYREFGHKKADLDPLGLRPKAEAPELTLKYHGLTSLDLDAEFHAGWLNFGEARGTLRSIIEALEETYCRKIGVQFKHVSNFQEQRWLMRRLETSRSRASLDANQRELVIDRMVAAEGLEKYLGNRYSGAKRFGLEGGESLIPMLAELVQQAGSNGKKEIVIGMAHRGRLNVLVNILGKTPQELIDEFEGRRFVGSSGDVKYHMGFSSNIMTAGGEVHLALAFNPSHLAIATPVVEGSVRARQDRRGDTEGDQVLPVVIHGDAAFAGQGVIMETFQMSQLRGYKTGGTIHIIVNNQVGFTTSAVQDTRSTEYCTDVAKMVDAPVIHVNGDDPESCWYAIRLAYQYRQEFHKDIVVDLVCYRRRGHNEADEPSGTQPLMYKKIRALPTTLTLYTSRLIEQGILTQAEMDQRMSDYRSALEADGHLAWNYVREPNTSLYVDWTPYLGHEWRSDYDTTFDLRRLQDLARSMNRPPEGFVLQRQVGKIFEDRYKMGAGALQANWGFAENMAYATLLDEGYDVRITGQDVRRGTFAHRHAVAHDQNTGRLWIPLQQVSSHQGNFRIFDSYLSEEAVLAFEYGYSTTIPNSLVIWEAQFGDFANGAQVVIDQFITSGEQKWARLCGLTMLLPHGYEGQGPEHSSARLERFMQLCAENNIQVCIPSTPAQVFHMLRRQVKRPLRKPLVVMSPKSLLRHKRAISSLEELAYGTFESLIGETENLPPEQVTRLVMCSGKVYYDLIEKREELGLNKVAVIRIEQVYPFPEDQLIKNIRMYNNLESIVWCQEEPQNQGCWYTSQHHIRHCVAQHRNKGLYLTCASRPPSAAPACGYMSVHVEQQAAVIASALGIDR
jgi:2-oxoglutarate dehydrogenase E1 component